MGDIGFTSEGEGRDLIEMLAEIPDLWDVNISAWENDSATSRFKAQGYQDDYVSFVKQVTTKPVVGVGRYTSPDAMVSLIKNGTLDFIGAARPSIADPFLPKKIEEGRVEDIRECIGCNICVSGDNNFVPIRCTQNPTMGEEWRRGWHPERILPKSSDDTVLIVGGGPSGLECARALGQRGYTVTLAEKSSELGGRVTNERRLLGLSEWGRASDYRTYQISQMPNVHCYLESSMTAQSIAEFGADHVVLATGARWVTTGIGRENAIGIKANEAAHILTPDDIMAGKSTNGPVVVFDDDHYYMGALIAEKLRLDGVDVTYVTPATEVSSWTHNTLEQHVIQVRLHEIGVKIITSHNLNEIRKNSAVLHCGYTGKETVLECKACVLVTMRNPVDDLNVALDVSMFKSVTRIGDCFAPSTIAAAIYSGHGYARELGEPQSDGVPFRRELPALADDFLQEK